MSIDCCHNLLEKLLFQQKSDKTNSVLSLFLYIHTYFAVGIQHSISEVLFHVLPADW